VLYPQDALGVKGKVSSWTPVASKAAAATTGV
jgi:hypothetical protein